MLSPEQIAELVRRALLRDEAAWSELVRYLGPTVQQAVATIAATQRVDRSYEMDLVQEVFLHIIATEALDKWDQKRGDLPPFIYDVARNRTLDLLRSRSRSPKALVPVGSEAIEQLVGGDSVSPAEIADNRKKLRAVQERLGKPDVGKDKRELFQAVVHDGQSPEEIAEKQGEKVDTVRRRLHRLRSLLYEAVSGSSRSMRNNPKVTPPDE